MAEDPVSAPHLSVECPGCRRRLRVKAELAGRRVKCPGCGGAIDLPRPEQPDAGTAPAAAPVEAPTAEPTAGRGPSRPSRRTALIAAGALALLLAAGAAWWLLAPGRLTEPQAKALAEREISRFLRDICSDNEAVRVKAVDRIMPDESFLKGLFGKRTAEVWALVSKVRDEARKDTAHMKKEVYADGEPLDLGLLNDNEWQNYKDKPLPAGVWVYTASWRFQEGCEVVVVGRRAAMFREFHVGWIMFGPEPGKPGAKPEDAARRAAMEYYLKWHDAAVAKNSVPPVVFVGAGKAEGAVEDVDLGWVAGIGLRSTTVLAASRSERVKIGTSSLSELRDRKTQSVGMLLIVTKAAMTGDATAQVEIAMRASRGGADHRYYLQCQNGLWKVTKDEMLCTMD